MEKILWFRNFGGKNQIHYVVFQISFFFLSKSKLWRVAAWRVCGRGGGVAMPRRPRETLEQVRSRLTREQAERTRKRVEELLVQSTHETGEQEQAEEESEVRQLLCQSRQLLREVEEERKGTIRVSLCCCYCIVCCVVCIVFCLISVLTLVVRQQQTDNDE